jgi:4-hydroxybenzoate polyprenyltransferase
MKAWWQYQKERFPLITNSLLIFVFSLSAVCYSSLLRSSESWPSFIVTVIVFISCLLIFLELRIADEFKDYAEDLMHRPYRPVPRGLVTLKALGNLALISMVLQLVLAFFVEPKLIFILLVVWIYWGLMWREFFVSIWLKNHPIIYLFSHMLIMPFIHFYASAFDWLVKGAQMPAGLIWFFTLSFFNGIIVEIGRKLRLRQHEEKGVDTYSSRYGIQKASRVWFATMVVSALLAYKVISIVDTGFWSSGVLLIGLLIGYWLVRRFQAQKLKSDKAIEGFSGLWILTIYVLVGFFPLLRRLF